MVVIMSLSFLQHVQMSLSLYKFSNDNGIAGYVIVTASLCHLNEFCFGVFGTSWQIKRAFSVLCDREEELLNYRPRVRSVYPLMTQIKIVDASQVNVSKKSASS